MIPKLETKRLEIDSRTDHGLVGCQTNVISVKRVLRDLIIPCHRPYSLCVAARDSNEIILFYDRRELRVRFKSAVKRSAFARVP